MEQSPPAKSSPKRPREKRSSSPSAESESLKQLRLENEELRQKLAALADTAAANEKIWRHFSEIERILFRTREVEGLVHELLREIEIRFQPDEIVLLLCHPSLHERFFPYTDQPNDLLAGSRARIFPAQTQACLPLGGSSPKPLLLSPESPESRAMIARFFPADIVQSVQSGVVIPLCIHQMLFGALFLGSQDACRYRPGDGTDLLEHLGIKIALCLDNCLAYERARDMGAEDPLTGLPGFFQVHTVLEREFRKARRSGASLSALLIDLSFALDVDQDLTVGSGILKHAAQVLTETLPREESFLARYGSDEFLVLLPGVQEDEAREAVPYVTRRLRKSPYHYQNTMILINGTIGVGTLTEEMERPQELLDAATSELCRLKIGQMG